MMDCPPLFTAAVEMMQMKMMTVELVVHHSFGGGAKGGAEVRSLRGVSGITGRGQRAAAGGGRRLAEGGGGGAAGADGVRPRAL